MRQMTPVSASSNLLRTPYADLKIVLEEHPVPKKVGNEKSEPANLTGVELQPNLLDGAWWVFLDPRCPRLDKVSSTLRIVEPGRPRADQSQKHLHFHCLEAQTVRSRCYPVANLTRVDPNCQANSGLDLDEMQRAYCHCRQFPGTLSGNSLHPLHVVAYARCPGGV